MNDNVLNLNLRRNQLFRAFVFGSTHVIGRTYSVSITVQRNGLRINNSEL